MSHRNRKNPYNQGKHSKTRHKSPDDLLHSVNTKNDVYDPELLNRTMYHKIQNEVSILKGITQQIIRKTDLSTLNDIVNQIEDISAGISQRSNKAKTTLKQIPSGDYQKILNAISTIAYDIVDFVNNEMAVLKAQVQKLLHNSDNKQLEKLLEQIEFTESALNDLKSVNASVDLHLRNFSLGHLLANWQNNSHFENAEIIVSINNPNTEFYGDEQKIKAFIKELIDNAIRHNSKQIELLLHIHVKTVVQLPNYISAAENLPIQNKHLCIVFSDNGKGIPKDKKEWIFLPLKSTSTEGSGLGLFIIKRMVQSMKGYIVERGKQGSHFEIYLPYGANYLPYGVKQWH